MSLAPGSEALLRLRDVAVAPLNTRTTVLKNVSFDLDAGECVAIVGPSGAGKTTLLRTLATMVPARAGEMRFNSQDIRGLSERKLRIVRRQIGMIAQKHDLIDTLTVDRNVMAGALGRWSLGHALRFLVWPNAAELDEARRALSSVGLADKLKRPTTSLSGGEQQRVAIARALVQGPSLLRADEPVASLDPATAEHVMQLLTGLARSNGMALVCSLHQHALADRFCERVLELRDGTVAERSTGR